MLRSYGTHWTQGRLLVVLDIGKSNAKIVLLDPLNGAEIASARHPNASVMGDPVRQLDLAGLTRWLVDTLASLPQRHRIGAIVPVAHGAACVMLDAGGNPLLAPDYEDAVLDEESVAYDALRDPFSQTFSPGLPTGLNLGRQIHFVQQRLPRLFDRVATILPYAQYWSYVLSGIAASEVTSLGCHTDLWFPAQSRFSAMAEKQGWARRFPAPRPAGDVLGPVRQDIASRCGLPADCIILCGIHDSNASYLCHRMHRPDAARFSVVSSGTWTVVLANGIETGALRADRDMLANVDAFGGLVGTARFMGGREYLAVAGEGAPPPTLAGLEQALAAGAMVLPGFAAGGPFQGRRGAIIRADGLDGQARAALATLYVALLTDLVLDLLQSGGDIMVDGPLAQNPLYARLLAALRPASPVFLGAGDAGPIGGARYLLLGKAVAPPALRQAEPLPHFIPRLREEKRRWTEALPEA